MKFRNLTLPILVSSALMLGGCENARFGNREKGALGGAAVGAGLGAIVGNQTGRAGEGVAIGSGFGALVGGLVGHSQDQLDDEQAIQEERMRRQDAELARQRRELEELRRGGGDYRDDYYDRQPRRYRDDYRADSYENDRYESDRRNDDDSFDRRY